MSGDKPKIRREFIIPDEVPEILDVDFADADESPIPTPCLRAEMLDISEMINTDTGKVFAVIAMRYTDGPLGMFLMTDRDHLTHIINGLTKLRDGLPPFVHLGPGTEQ